MFTLPTGNSLCIIADILCLWDIQLTFGVEHSNKRQKDCVVVSNTMVYEILDLLVIDNLPAR